MQVMELGLVVPNAAPPPPKPTMMRLSSKNRKHKPHEHNINMSIQYVQADA